MSLRGTDGNHPDSQRGICLLNMGLLHCVLRSQNSQLLLEGAAIHSIISFFDMALGLQAYISGKTFMPTYVTTIT